MLKVSVSSSGQAAKIHVLESQPPGIFDTAALDAVRNWVFEPAFEGGQPVASTILQRVRFDLQ